MNRIRPATWSMLRNRSHEAWTPYALLGLLVVALWVPRIHGPIDLRWDGGVYDVPGPSLAEGKGYRLLNEPGEIQAKCLRHLPDGTYAALRKAIAPRLLSVLIS